LWLSRLLVQISSRDLTVGLQEAASIE
jgi:hypothetical protein